MESAILVKRLKYDNMCGACRVRVGDQKYTVLVGVVSQIVEAYSGGESLAGSS
jgi:hypothetical protein